MSDLLITEKIKLLKSEIDELNETIDYYQRQMIRYQDSMFKEIVKIDAFKKELELLKNQEAK